MPNNAISSEAIKLLRKEFVAGATSDELMKRYSITSQKVRFLTTGYTRLSNGQPLLPSNYRRAATYAANRPYPVVARVTINLTLVVTPDLFLDDDIRENLNKVLDNLVTQAGAEPVVASCHPQYLLVIVRLDPAVSLNEFVDRLRNAVMDHLASAGLPDAIWLNGYHATSSGDPHASEVLQYVDSMRSFAWQG